MGTRIYEGFWLPAPLRETVLEPSTPYETVWFRAGQPTEESDAEVGVRWPRLSLAQWQIVLEYLISRTRSPSADEYTDRWRRALVRATPILAQELPMSDLAEVTGFTPAMLAFALRALQWMEPSHLAAAARATLDPTAASRFVPLAPLPGMVRFYPTTRFPFGRRLSLSRDPVTFIVGFAAGNVIGGALLPILLAQLSTPTTTGNGPAILMKNSRHEAIFTPLVLSAIARTDPDLLANVAVMIWDYANPDLQRRLLGQADLVLASADDTTIDAIGQYVPPAARYHRHGHKVSFTTVGRNYAAGTHFPLDQLVRLTALDSVFWDQFGCLSSRIHFVEGPAEEYAEALCHAMDGWGEQLPRGGVSLRRQHIRFDRYVALEATGQVHVFSQYDDPFLVVLDQRPVNRMTLSETINDAVDRTVFVRPVTDLMDVPDTCLAALTPASLQSMSVAMDMERLVPFAEAIGARGITALRGAGRGAFPSLAHSWDGRLPLDFVYRRSDGYFTTIDFDDVDAVLGQTLDWVDGE